MKLADDRGGKAQTVMFRVLPTWQLLETVSAPHKVVEGLLLGWGFVKAGDDSRAVWVACLIHNLTDRVVPDFGDNRV